MGTKRTFRSRQHPINAGSMADIAFLLLVFFLVTTTLELDQGIARLLAPMSEAPPAPIAPRDLLTVSVNEAGELMVRDQATDLAGLRAGAKAFLTNPDDLAELPTMLSITEAECMRRMATLGDGSERAVWEQRLDAVRLIGPFREPPAKAQIMVRSAAGTTYATYLSVQDELEGALRELRDVIAQRAFGREFDALDEHDPLDRARIKAIRRAVPQRIGDAALVGR